MNTIFLRAAAIALVATSAIEADATTVAVVWTSGQIVIASDSLFQDFQPNGIHNMQGCKIGTSGSFFFAATGVIHDDEAQLDTYATLRKHFVGSGRIRPKASMAAAEIQGRLLQAFQFAHRTLPAAEYNQQITSKSAGGFVVTTFDKSGPIIVTVEFFRQDDVRGNPIKMVPHITLLDKPLPNYVSFRLLGITPAAMQMTKTKGFFGGDIATSARKLIQVEIDNRPDRVGPPIDVLTIDGSGHSWVSPYGECRHSNQRAGDYRR